MSLVAKFRAMPPQAQRSVLLAVGETPVPLTREEAAQLQTPNRAATAAPSSVAPAAATSSTAAPPPPPPPPPAEGTHPAVTRPPAAPPAGEDKANEDHGHMENLIMQALSKRRHDMHEGDA